MDSCKNKKVYDMEFEADRAAAQSEHWWSEEMHSYKHGSHWHIAHVDRNLSNKHLKAPVLDPKELIRCAPCQCWLKRGRMPRHKKTNSHIRLVAKKRAP